LTANKESNVDWDIEKAELSVDSVSEYIKALFSEENKIALLKTIKQKIIETEEFVFKCVKSISVNEKQLIKMLPDECPFCHSKIDKDKFVGGE
jgi:Zn finger protein HypA/HybF involved in hydrogenase expression